MAERVGALAYDLVMNTVRFEKGMKKTRSSLKTLNQNFRKAAKPIEEYEQRIRDLDLALEDGQITKEQRQIFGEQELKSLEKAGFVIDKNGKAQKTEVKILEEKIDAQKEVNQIKRLEKKLQDEMNYEQNKAFTKRRFRSAEEHRKVIQRAHEIKKLNKGIFVQRALDAKHSFKQTASFISGMSAGQQAGVFGNIAGALGASGATIGAVRGAAMLGKKMVPLVATVGALGLGMKKAAENAHQLRKITIDLSVLMGNSDEAAANLISRFQKMARETPLTTAQLAEGARQLMAFGRQARFVEDDLRNIGTIAGGDVERMRLLVKAFGDVTAAGKLQGQELRQFTNQGFNPLRKMVDMTGESYDNLRKKMEEGKISAEMVAAAMAASAEDFAGRLEKSMNTVGGQWSKLKGLLAELSAKPGGPIERGFAGLLSGVNATIESTEFVLDKMSNGIEDVVNKQINAMSRIREFVTLDFTNAFRGGNRFGKLMNTAERAALEEQKRKDILKAQAEAQKVEGRTIMANRDLMDDVAKKIREQKDLVRELDYEFRRIDEFGQMRIDAKLQRKALQFTEKDFNEYIDQINELERLKEEEEKKRAMIDKPIEDAQKMHDHMMKMIDEEEKRRIEEAENVYKKEMDFARNLRAGGGPSEDFTKAGADYRFVQQRNAEIEATKREEAANNRRAEQLESIKQELIETRRQQQLDTDRVMQQLNPV